MRSIVNISMHKLPLRFQKICVARSVGAKISGMPEANQSSPCARKCRLSDFPAPTIHDFDRFLAKFCFSDTFYEWIPSPTR